MALSQFVVDWNNVSSFKVSVAELKKPTPSILLEMLQSFLTDIHKIDCGMLRSRMDERRFKVWLIKYFNDFFKASKVQQELIYLDFLQTDSKKVISLLMFLLNFRQFFKAVATEISENANNKIDEYNQLLSKKIQLKVKQEEHKLRVENKEIQLKESTRLISEYKKSLKDLETKSALLDEQTETVAQQCSRIQEENIKLANDVKELECLIVTEDELHHLRNYIKVADDENTALDYAEKNTYSRNEAHSREMCQLNTEIEELSTIAGDNYALDMIEKFRTEMKSLTDMSTKVKVIENKIKDSATKRLEVIEKTKILDNELATTRNILKSLLGSIDTKTAAMESELKQGLIRNTNISKTFEEAKLKVENLKIIQEDLIAAGIEVVKQIENS